MQIEKKIFEKLEVCIISAHGHCGVDWITSLLDGP